MNNIDPSILAIINEKEKYLQAAIDDLKEKQRGVRIEFVSNERCSRLNNEVRYLIYGLYLCYVVMFGHGVLSVLGIELPIKFTGG
jgi:hypothetical protein